MWSMGFNITRLQVKLSTAPVATLGVVLVGVIGLQAEPPRHGAVGLESPGQLSLRAQRLVGAYN